MGVANYTMNEDPSRRLTWDDDGTVTIWDVAKGTLVTKPVALREATVALVNARKHSKGANDDSSRPRVAFNRQGTRLVIYGSDEGSFVAQLWDAESGRALAKLGSPQHVTFNREGTFFATWNEDGDLTLRRSSDGQSVPIYRLGNRSRSRGSANAGSCLDWCRIRQHCRRLRVLTSENWKSRVEK
jgi:WD40 repeat protein